jgi:multidrug efflux pump
MRFTDLFIRRPVLSIVVSLLILLIGARAFFDLTVRQYPELQNTVIQVTTSFPGADPNLMQGFITQPIEQAVSSAEGIDYMTSSSTQGLSTVSVYVRLNYDPSKAMTDVMAKVQQVKYLLPQESNDPVIVKQTGDSTAIMYIGFASSELNEAAITDHLSRVVQPLLATIDGVAQAEILGGQTFAMRLWLDPARMTALGVTASDVATAIRANNYQSAPGQTKGYFTVSSITANTDLKSLDEFRRMVVRAGNGTLIRLEDIGTVDLSAQSYDSSVMMNGQHAVFIGVQSTPTGNPLNIVEDVRAMVPDLERSLPPTVKMDIAYDSTKFIKSSINEVEHTLALAIGIVIVVIFLFLGTFRSVVIPVVTIPLSLIGAFVIMLAFGFSINLLTLLAMVLAIGLVVDDAIVVVENIHRHIEEGLTPIQAALLGAREIAGPVIAMTITLAAVYTPIGFLSGLTGTLFREFAFTLAGTVVISGIIALTLSPMMCSVLLKRGMNQGWFPHLVDRVFGATERFYARRLHGSLNHRAAVALFGAVIMVLLVFFYMHSRAELAPDEDQGVIFAMGKGPQYANLDYTKIFSDQVDQVYSSFPETNGRFIVNGFSGLNSSISGMVLKEWEDRTRGTTQMLPEVQDKLNQITGMQVFAFNLPALPGGTGGLPVSMVISAPEDFPDIYKNMEILKQKAQASGLFMVVDSDLNFNSPMVRVNIDRAKASDMGITMQAIGDTMALMVGGNYVNRFNLNGRSYEVIPQVTRGERLTPGRLAEYYVRTVSGNLVPLSTVVSIGSGIDPNALTHYNQLNSATFSAVPGIGITMGQAVDFLNKTADEALPASYHRDFLSESRQFVREGNQLAVTFVFALVIIYLVLAAQFESLRDPIVILVSVPLSICGAMIPMFMGVQTLNIYTQVGLVTLIGLISKHGILMTEFANQLQRKEGLSRREAIQQAAVVRLRPILMTTAAMVVGLVPLLMATGAGAASRFAIGITIVLGMGIGTLFTLFVLPTFYTLLATDHREANRQGRKAEIEAVS